MARINAAFANKNPVNIKGAKRNHPRLRLVAPARPTGNYEIVHGAVVLPDPDHEPTATEPFRLAYYFPGEVIRLDGRDAEMLLARGIVVPAGEDPVLHHTMPDRGRSYYDTSRLDANGVPIRNDDPHPEGIAKLVSMDIDQASERMYSADSSSERLGSLNGSGR